MAIPRILLRSRCAASATNRLLWFMWLNNLRIWRDLR